MILRAALSLLLPWLALVAAADETRLVPEAVFAGEVAELIIEVDHPTASLPPLDTAPLARDFRVLDVTSRVTRMLDAAERPFHRAQWRIQIAPRRDGRLPVPALAVGERRSKPLTLEVRPAAALQARHDVWIEVEATPPDPYLGQEIRVTTRVYHGSAFDWARLAEPRSDAVARYQHGGDRRRVVERDGRQYRVLERTQSLFARRAGELVLSEAEFRGRFGSGTGFDDRWLHRHSEALRLRVRPPPPGSAARAWLPARRVELALQWTPPARPPAPGEPVDFTLTISAAGLAAEFLPAGLLARAGDGYIVFADRERREDLLDGDALVGRLVQRYALVASRGGEIAVPGVALDWWDTGADAPRRAELAPTRLTIAAAVADAPPADTVGPWSWPRWSITLGGAVGLSLFAAGIGWRGRAIVRGVAAWRRRRRCRRRLRDACRANDARAARAALADWDALHRATGTSPALRAARRDLDAVLYAPRPRPWDGAALWRAVAAPPAGKAPRAGEPRLPGLYPPTGAARGGG